MTLERGKKIILMSFFLYIMKNAEDEKTESHYNTKEMKTLTSFFCCC